MCRFISRLFPLLALGVLGACATSPPVQEMSDARQAIRAAVAADAQNLAPEQLEQARELLEQAERLIGEESFGPARMNAVRARNRALRALEISQADD